MPPLLRLALIGAAGWVIATVGLRLLPAWPGLSWGLGLSILAACAGLILLVGILVRGLPRESRAAGAVALALPGMIGDAFATAHFAQVFPSAPPSAPGLFGGAMLLGYAAILAAGLLAARR